MHVPIDNWRYGIHKFGNSFPYLFKDPVQNDPSNSSANYWTFCRKSTYIILVIIYIKYLKINKYIYIHT